jgi:hypothetical protein
LKTNAELCSLIYDISGKISAPRTSKKVLVARVEKLQAKAAKTAAAATAPKPFTAGKSKKPSKRGCLAALSPGVIVEMQRVAALDADVMAGRCVVHLQLYLANTLSLHKQLPESTDDFRRLLITVFRMI